MSSSCTTTSKITQPKPGVRTPGPSYEGPGFFVHSHLRVSAKINVSASPSSPFFDADFTAERSLLFFNAFPFHLSSNLMSGYAIYLPERRRCPMDILFIGITIALFVASWFFVKLVERV
jgi:hypothetical protein